MDKSGPSLIARALRRGDLPGAASLARGFRLGGWQVRPDLCTLDKDEQHIPLEPKTMGVLLCLAQHAPGVVTREQFIEEVWNGRVVSDEVLSRAVSLLRGQFHDDAAEPKFIRTVPRVGYALVAPVAPLTGDESPPAAARAFSWRLPVALAIVVVAGLLSWLALRNGSPSGDAAAPAGPVRLAVLPLEYLGTAQQDRYMADGLTEELTVSLSRVQGLRVVARNSVRAFTDSGENLDAIARQLGTTHLVTGSVRADGHRLRVTVHLSDSNSGMEVWADSYDRGLGDLFAVQAEIAAAVTRALRERLPTAAVAHSALTQAPASADAYRWFLQGRQQLARRGDDGIRAAISLLEDSVAADPAFLRAQLALAYAYSLLANVAPAESATSLARADQVLATVARQTAMSGEIHAVRAALELERNRWIEAADAFRAALRATPDDTELRLLHSQMLGAVGEAEAALEEARLALASDPLSPAVNLRLAVLLLWADQEQEAARYLKVARDLGLAASAAPELSMLLLVRDRRFDELNEALVQVQLRRGQASDWVPAVIAAIEDARHGSAAGTAIDHAAAAGQLDELMHLGALVLTRQHERALRLLQSRQTLRTLELEFLWSREAAELRQQPGFGQVVTQFGLAAYWDRTGWPQECARARDAILCS